MLSCRVLLHSSLFRLLVTSLSLLFPLFAFASSGFALHTVLYTTHFFVYTWRDLLSCVGIKHGLHNTQGLNTKTNNLINTRQLGEYTCGKLLYAGGYTP